MAPQRRVSVDFKTAHYNAYSEHPCILMMRICETLKSTKLMFQTGFTGVATTERGVRSKSICACTGSAGGLGGGGGRGGYQKRFIYRLLTRHGCLPVWLVEDK